MYTEGPYYLPGSYHPYGHHTYKEIAGPGGYLAKLQTFAGHNMHGGWTKDGNGRAFFEVYSYDTRIAYCYPGQQPSINLGNYSPTTSKHQGLCIAWLGNALLGADVVAA